MLSAVRPVPAWYAAVVALAKTDVAVMLGVALLAGAVRLPNLLTIPRFTDEQLDVLYTLPLYRHQAIPLVGLALQTHPSVLAFLPGAALGMFVWQPRLSRSRWSLAAIALFVLAYGNVLVYNLVPEQLGLRADLNRGLLPNWGLGGREDTFS